MKAAKERASIERINKLTHAELAGDALKIAQCHLDDELYGFCMDGGSEGAYRIRAMRMAKELMVFIEALERERRGPAIA